MVGPERSNKQIGHGIRVRPVVSHNAKHDWVRNGFRVKISSTADPRILQHLADTLGE